MSEVITSLSQKVNNGDLSFQQEIPIGVHVENVIIDSDNNLEMKLQQIDKDIEEEKTIREQQDKKIQNYLGTDTFDQFKLYEQKQSLQDNLIQLKEYDEKQDKEYENIIEKTIGDLEKYPQTIEDITYNNLEEKVEDYNKKVYTEISNSLSTIKNSSQSIYSGRNLALEENGSWTWGKIQELVSSLNPDYSSIQIGDYLPIALYTDDTNRSIVIFKMTIAGIDSYTKIGMTTGKNSVGHHIDFISEQLINIDTDSTGIQWNENISFKPETKPNSGYYSPYLNSYIYDYLNNNIYNKIIKGTGGLEGNEGYKYLPMPENAIQPKMNFIETRTWTDIEVTHAFATSYENVGLLWVPSEFEVIGSSIYGSKWDSAIAVQYPLFINGGTSKRIKSFTNSISTPWWTSTPVDGEINKAVAIGTNGTVSSYPINKEDSQSTAIYVPLCFRIGAANINA